MRKILILLSFVFVSNINGQAYLDEVVVVGCEPAAYRQDIYQLHNLMRDIIAYNAYSCLSEAIDNNNNNPIEVLHMAKRMAICAYQLGEPCVIPGTGIDDSCCAGMRILVDDPGNPPYFKPSTALELLLSLNINFACDSNNGGGNTGGGNTGGGSSGGGVTGGGDDGGDGDDNGDEDPNTCNKCGKNPCECPGCPEVYGVTVIDNNSDSRRGDVNTPLMMVSSNGDRNARIILNGDFSNCREGFPKLRGQGFYPVSNIFYQFRGGIGEHTYEIKYSNDCAIQSGKVVVVSESKHSLSYKIKEVENKINAVGTAINSGLRAFGESSNKETQFKASLSGAIVEKNVDKYGDGSNVGKYYSIGVNGNVRCELPEIRFYIANYGIAKIYAFLSLGVASCGLNLDAVKDPSKMNEYSCSGNISLAFENPGLGIKGLVGVENKLCVIITAQVTLTKFEISNGLTIESNGLYHTPKITFSNAVADIACTGKFFNDYECKLFESENYMLFEGDEMKLDKEIIYSF